MMPTLKCRRSHEFSKCDDCVQLKSKLQSIARVPGKERERDKLKKTLATHLISMLLERAEYRRIQTLASEHPNEILAVIIDGADQAKFGVPRLGEISKKDSGLALKQKVTGVLFHGGLSRQDFVALLTSAEAIPSGSNQTVHAFCRSLLCSLRSAKRLELPTSRASCT